MKWSLWHFNSTLVRLIALWFKEIISNNCISIPLCTIDSCHPFFFSLSPSSSFQFHFGTIDRNSWILWNCVCWTFQFHFGTIDRNLIYDKGAEIAYFNSTLVRLIEKFFHVTFILKLLFQFHFGTIDRSYCL